MNIRTFLSNIIPVRIKFLKKSRFDPEDKFGILQKHVKFNIEPGEKILDIGSGGYPFPQATHLADLYETETTHRMESLIKDKRPFTKCDIQNLPFKNKEFDFVFCSHLLEHVEDPAKACEELMRVGKRGYIETPTKTADIMFNFIYLENHHKWHVTQLENTLIFIEWLPNERKSTGTKYFKHQLFSKWENQFQKLVIENNHLFNNMFLWKDGFYYYVISKSGNIIKTNHHSHSLDIPDKYE